MNNCKLCKSKRFSPIFVVRKFDIEKCKKCGLARTRQKPVADYEEYHRDEAEYKVDEELFKNIFTKRYNIISKFKNKSGRILDVGASTGTLLSVFKDHGWDVWGIEPSASAIYARKKGIKMTRASFEKASLPNNHFDIVIMNHTFEHVDDPVRILTKIKSVLKRGGLVYIDVPNFGSLDAFIKGKEWGYLMPEEHTFHYTPESLVKIFEEVGLEVEWVRTWSGIYDVANPIKKLWYQLMNLRMALFKDIIKIPFNTATTLLGRGAGLAVIGRKI